jgi:hypothetical protein
MNFNLNIPDNTSIFYHTIYNDLIAIGEIKNKTFEEFLVDMLEVLKENLGKN